jgi:FkbM family methyltransferase
MTAKARVVLRERVKHWANLASQPEYRRHHGEVQRLRDIPRYTRAHTDLLGKRLELVDAETFLSTYNELFEREIYRFETSREDPLIIDGGANIGLSVLYFKKLYPRSRIIAFEPDPRIFQVLEKNCATFALQDVELVPKALWICETQLDFVQEGSVAGRVSGDQQLGKIIKVGATRLNNYLNQSVDFLKLDIEGAETDVLKDCVNKLFSIQRLFVEYHSLADRPQCLHELISILHSSGFRLHIHSLLPSPQPFVNRNNNFGFDFQANVFAFRP